MKFIYEHMTMIGMQDHLGQWWKVAKFCARCGECCKNIGTPWVFSDGAAGCIYLKKEDDGETYRCDLRGYRPQICSQDSPFSKLDYCSVKLVKIDGPSSLL